MVFSLGSSGKATVSKSKIVGHGGEHVHSQRDQLETNGRLQCFSSVSSVRRDKLGPSEEHGRGQLFGRHVGFARTECRRGPPGGVGDRANGFGLAVVATTNSIDDVRERSTLPGTNVASGSAAVREVCTSAGLVALRNWLAGVVDCVRVGRNRGVAAVKESGVGSGVTAGRGARASPSAAIKG